MTHQILRTINIFLLINFLIRHELKMLPPEMWWIITTHLNLKTWGCYRLTNWNNYLIPMKSDIKSRSFKLLSNKCYDLKCICGRKIETCYGNCLVDNTGI